MQYALISRPARERMELFMHTIARVFICTCMLGVVPCTAVDLKPTVELHEFVAYSRDGLTDLSTPEHECIVDDSLGEALYDITFH